MDKQAKTAASHQAALHSVQQKQLSKSWKKPEHQSPAAPKVYRVDPRGFRDLVQQLTGASPAPSSSPLPIQNSRPLRDTAPAPPPLNLAPRQAAPEHRAAAELPDDSRTDGGASSTGFMDLLSPSFFSGWWPLHGQGSQEGLEAQL